MRYYAIRRFGIESLKLPTKQMLGLQIVDDIMTTNENIEMEKATRKR